MKKYTKQSIKIFLEHARKYKLGYFVVIFSIVLAGILSAVVPIFFKKFFDLLASGQARDVIFEGLIGILVMLAVLEFFQWLSWRIATFTAVYVQTKVSEDLANTCFQYIHRHSFQFFENTFVGSLVKKVNKFTRALENVSGRVMFEFNILTVNIAIIICVLLWRNIILGVGMLVWIIIFLVVSWMLSIYKLKYDKQRSEAETESSSFLADTITNYSNIKLFAAYYRESKGFAGVQEKVRRIRNFVWNMENAFEALQAFMNLTLEISILYIAIVLWNKGLITVGDFVLIQSYLLIIIIRVWNFGRLVRHSYQDMADAEEMTEILMTPHDIVDVKSAKKLDVKRGEIKYKDVTFNYHKTRSVISDMNLVIQPGEKVAFVGPSGAGKSTLAKLLLRQYDLSAGSIEIDGQSISRVTQESLWNNVGFVPQDPILFHRTVIENIQYGKIKASNKEVTRAVKLSHAHDFITELPDGYDTYVGERGIKLSGGERQRIAIARAILKNAPILVLDEATSSLDSGSERLIQQALDNLMKNKTVIVIAHRLSTIMKMDRIVVIDNGRIMEAGTHDELLVKRGIYSKLWEIQAGGFIS